MDRPKLRKVERVALCRGDDRLLVLRDPLRIAESVAIDEEFAPVLDLLDGTRTVAQVRQSLLLRGTLDVPEGDLAQFVGDLDGQGLLEGERFAARWQAELARFIAAPTRAATLGDVAYPADPAQARRLMDEILPPIPDRFEDRSRVVGVLCPHQPPSAVAAVLDATLRELPPADELDLIVVLATDHAPGLLPYALTSKPYETALGELPTAGRLVRALEQRVGWALREEVRHRQADSLEIAALLIRALWGERAPPILPLLCGRSSLDASASGQVDELLANLEVLVDDDRVLYWASAELCHVGPAYEAVGPAPARVWEHEEGILEALVSGRPEQLARRLAHGPAALRSSGAPALSTLAKLLPVGARGHVTAHEALAAPGTERGVLGVAGARLSARREDLDDDA
jgi:AmmeMemoRadiSam system protein B